MTIELLEPPELSPATAMPIGTKVVVPNRTHLRKTGTLGRLTVDNPIIHTWGVVSLGWPQDQEYTVTGLADLRDIKWELDAAGTKRERLLSIKRVYRVRRTMTSREYFIDAADMVAVS